MFTEEFLSRNDLRFRPSKIAVFQDGMCQVGDYRMVVDRVLSKSTFGVLSDRERENVKNMIEDLVLKHFETLDYDRITLSYDTDVLVTSVY